MEHIQDVFICVLLTLFTALLCVSCSLICRVPAVMESNISSAMDGVDYTILSFLHDDVIKMTCYPLLEELVTLPPEQVSEFVLSMMNSVFK